MVDLEWKLQEFLDRKVKKSKTKGLNINYKKNKKKTEYFVVSKTNSPRCKLQIWDVKIKQVQKCIYLGSVIAGDRKWDTDI